MADVDVGDWGAITSAAVGVVSLARACQVVLEDEQHLTALSFSLTLTPPFVAASNQARLLTG